MFYKSLEGIKKFWNTRKMQMDFFLQEISILF